MNYLDGSWLAKPGYCAKRPTRLIEYRIGEDRLYLLVLCHDLVDSADFTRGPAIEFELFSPRPDMIGVRAVHFRGVLDKGPFFELNTEKNDFHVEDCADYLNVYSGRMRCQIDKRGAISFSFYYDERLLTQSQANGLAYVTDVDYQAKDHNDYSHLAPNHNSIDKTYMCQRLTLDVDEYIYGLGERFTPLVRNGQNLSIWNADGGSDCDQAYKSIPFYLSSRGYGVLVNTPDFVDYEIGTVSVRHVQFSVERERIEYIVMAADTPLNVLARYTSLTGCSAIPPAWSFGLWLSTSWINEFTGDEIIGIIDRMKSLGIPLSVFHFDARWMADFHDCDFIWHERYADPREMLHRIHERGVKVCCWINPYVSQPSRLFDEGLENGYFLKRKNGDIYQNDEWLSGMAIVDFTNPEAASWYAGRLGEVLDMGVDTIKTDFGERIPTDVVYFDGSDPQKMHNYYSLLYNRVIYNLLKEKYGERNACVFGRSCTVGSQAFPLHWGGDNHASYVSMAESLRGGLSFCQSGFGFWAHDISGFNSTATPDLYKRWAAFGMLSTHSRLHGNESPRMPWYFDEESAKVLAHFARLKCSLMPYIFSNAVRVSLEGRPEMRAMMLDFPNDRNCLYLDKQYMLGDSLLVAPVFNDRGEVDFYVPEGNWTDLQTGEIYEGGRWHSGKFDYYHLPLLVRPNSIIPTGKSTHTVYDYADGITYSIYQLANGCSASCRIYDAQAREVVCMTARREGDVIELIMTGSDATKPFRVLLAGISSCKTDGTVETTDNNTVIIPVSASTKQVVRRLKFVVVE